MAHKVEYTEAQLQAINDRFDEMLVSASAGSGKTTVMIERIVSLIKEGVDVNSMVISTFTKAAAADMRTKLYKSLSELASTNKDLAEKQLRALATAQISTLHSFCQQLIKTYFYAIKTDPDFSVLSDTDAETLLMECIEKEVLKRKESLNADFAVIYEVMLHNRSSKPLCECIKNIYEFASVQPDFDGFLDTATDNIDKHEEHIKVLQDEYVLDFLIFEEQAFKLLNKTAEAEFKRNIEACAVLYEDIRKRIRSEAAVSGKLPNDYYLLQLNKDFLKLKGDYNKLFDKVDSIKNSADPKRSLDYTKILLDITRCVKHDYETQKQKHGYKDYSDLEHDALLILKNPEVKKQVDSKYLYIFVDEYQDINPLQESIISQFAAKKFFVGDIKQSIYSFRMCTPEIFLSKRLRLKSVKDKSGKALELNSNFRSTNEILKLCNEAFSYIMSPDFGGCDYKNEAMFDIKEDSLKDGAALSEDAEVAATLENVSNVDLFLVNGKADPEHKIKDIYSVKNHKEDDESIGLMDAEIHLILNYIIDLVSPKESGGKGALFKDIAILLRSVNGDYAKRLKAVLAKNGIPTFLQEKKSVADNDAVITLVSFLTLIDNHDDDITLTAVLKSPLGLVNDDELVEIANSYKGSESSFFEAVRAAAKNDSIDFTLREKLVAFLDILDKFTRLAYIKNASQILGDICAEFDYFKHVFASKDGDVKAKELAAFLTFAEESVFKTSVGEFVRALQRKMPEIQLSGEADAVSIMTIHASKGLEFPYVILGNLSKEHNFMDLSNTMLLDNELGAALKVWDLENHTTENSSLYLRTKSKLRKKSCEEEVRVLYVAMTRAKKGLALFARVPNVDKIKLLLPQRAISFFGLLTPLFLKYAQQFDIKDCKFKTSLYKKRIYNRDANLLLVDKIKEYINQEIESLDSYLPTKTVVTKLAKSVQRVESDSDYDSKLVGKVNPKGALKGSYYHAFFEQVSFDYKDESVEFERLKALLGQDSELVDRATFFKALRTIKAFIDNRKFYREKPFVCNFDASEVMTDNDKMKETDAKILVQGVVDLIIDDKDGYIVLDYKSGKIDVKALSVYKKQLDLYAHAIEKILKKPVKEKLIFSLDSLEFIKV